MPVRPVQPARRSWLALVATPLLLAACSTGPSGGTGAAPAASTGQSASGSGAVSGLPVTISHAFGSTTIDAAPQRVAVAGWSDQDLVLDLGVVPVGQPAITWGGNAGKSTDAFDARLAQLGGTMPTQYSDAEGTPVDEIATLAPDLIVATNSGLTQAEYDRLSKVAKVVPYPEKAWGTPWDVSLDMVGKALGRSSQATELKARTNAAIDSAKAANPALAGTSVAWVWFTPNDLSTVGVYTSSDNRPAMLRSLGMKDASIVTTLSTANPTAFSANVSAEKADTIDADVLIWVAEGAPSLAELQKHALLGRIPAVKRGSVVVATDNAETLAMSSPTTLNIPAAMTSFVPKIAAAAAKAGPAAG